MDGWLSDVTARIGAPLQDDAVRGDSRPTTDAAACGDEPYDGLPQAFGRYEIIKRLGRGGMGAVYLARDVQLDRHVAIKVPRFSTQDAPRRLERFQREARAAATLDHPHICSVYVAG